jgi:hypothetical protein
MLAGEARLQRRRHSAADALRSKALSANPFADKVSGLAMEGVNKIHRQVLGQADELGKQVESFGKEDLNKGSQSVLRISPPPRPAAGSTASDRAQTVGENLVGSQSRNEQVALAAQSTPATRNRFNAPVVYEDPDTGQSFNIPSGHTLYRNPATADLYVVEESQVQRSQEDGRMVNGQIRCSMSGKGLVLAECERRRKMKNPF